MAFEIPAWVLATLFGLTAVARYVLRTRETRALTTVAVLARVLMAMLYFVIAFWPTALALQDRPPIARIGLVMLCLAEIGTLPIRRGWRWMLWKA